MQIDEERMSDAMTKFHLRGPWPFHPVIHRFTDVDHGDPHDHPWSFRSIILSGSYVEEHYRYRSANSVPDIIRRDAGDSFLIRATHIHRIVELPEGECWTLILPETPERVSGFWQFREDGAYHRYWNGDWKKWSPPAPGECDV